MTPFPHFTFIVVIQLNKRKRKLKIKIENDLAILPSHDILTCCKKVEFTSQHKEPVPLPDIVNEKEKYKVEEIRGHQKKRRGTQFLIHWKGYRNEHN